MVKADYYLGILLNLEKEKEGISDSKKKIFELIEQNKAEVIRLNSLLANPKQNPIQPSRDNI